MLILFDIDDTLIDHGTAERIAAGHLHRLLQLPGLREDFLQDWTIALDHHFARFLAGKVSHQGQRRDRIRDVVDLSLPDKEADVIYAEYAAIYEASWKLYDDVLPCLAALTGHRLGVISNGQGEQQRRKLKRIGLLERFDCVLVADECGCAKPHPQIFTRACAHVGETTANSAYIGDRYDIDAIAARTAGLQGIWLDRHLRATAAHEPPIVNSLVELSGMLGNAREAV